MIIMQSAFGGGARPETISIDRDHERRELFVATVSPHTSSLPANTAILDTYQTVYRLQCCDLDEIHDLQLAPTEWNVYINECTMIVATLPMRAVRAVCNPCRLIDLSGCL